jgi:hypothetical protein
MTPLVHALLHGLSSHLDRKSSGSEPLTYFQVACGSIKVILFFLIAVWIGSVIVDEILFGFRALKTEGVVVEATTDKNGNHRSGYVESQTIGKQYLHCLMGQLEVGDRVTVLYEPPTGSNDKPPSPNGSKPSSPDVKRLTLDSFSDRFLLPLLGVLFFGGWSSFFSIFLFLQVRARFRMENSRGSEAGGQWPHL